MRGMRRVVVAAILAAVPGAAARAADGEPVIERCLVSVIDEAKVPAREAGVLVKLAIREGDAVRADEPIAEIDDSQPRMELEKATAEHAQAVAKAKSDVDVRFAEKSKEVAKTASDKAEAAHKRTPDSVTEVDRLKYKLEWEKAQLQIEQANLERQLAALAVDSKQAEVDAANNGIERRQIKSPLEGIVVQVFPHKGEWMQPGDPLARVVRTDKLKVEGFVDAAVFGPEQVRDRPVTVSVPLANQRRESFQGRIVVVSPLEESGGDYRVVAEVENRRDGDSGDWLLRPGKSVTMTIHSRQPPLPPVRRQAAP